MCNYAKEWKSSLRMCLCGFAGITESARYKVRTSTRIPASSAGAQLLRAWAREALRARCDPSHSKPRFKVASAKSGLELKFSLKRFDLRSTRFVVNELGGEPI